jgi:hypothetical protein
MRALQEVGPEFFRLAHSIVWCAVATVDEKNRPWSRIMHPRWEWDGAALVGWIATGKTPILRAHLAHSPYVSCAYLAPDHDTVVAECEARWITDDETRIAVWNKFKEARAPVGYDPAIVPEWTGPTSDAFGVMRLDPWRLLVQPGSFMLTAGRVGEIDVWQQ